MPGINSFQSYCNSHTVHVNGSSSSTVYINGVKVTESSNSSQTSDENTLYIKDQTIEGNLICADGKNYYLENVQVRGDVTITGSITAIACTFFGNLTVQGWMKLTNSTCHGYVESKKGIIASESSFLKGITVQGTLSAIKCVFDRSSKIIAHKMATFTNCGNISSVESKSLITINTSVDSFKKFVAELALGKHAVRNMRM